MTDLLIQSLLSYLISIAANLRTSAIQGGHEEKLRYLVTEMSGVSIPASFGSLRSEIATAAAMLAADDDQYTPTEASLLRLFATDAFQVELVGWLMTGSIEEGRAHQQSLLSMIEGSLRATGAPHEQLQFLRDAYFETVERAVFANPVLARWRHQASLDYLREQVTAGRIMIEALVGQYSTATSENALRRYCDMALNAWDIIDLSNLPEGDVQIATQALLLRQLYVPLRLTVEAEERIDDLERRRDNRRRADAGRDVAGEAATGVAGSSADTARTPIPIGQSLHDGRRLVVLGDPGAGKTTLLRWMATAYLLRFIDDPAFSQLPDTDTLPPDRWIPVLIRCRDLGEADLSRSFTDFITQHFKKTELQPEEADVMRAVVLDRIRKGEALILVDGLDEISDPRVRVTFCQELERTAARYPAATIIVTSRVVGYRDMPYRMGRGFRHGVIADLTPEDKDLFAVRWIAVTEQRQTSDERAKRTEELIGALHSSDRIERLTGNPLLLTTLALVKRKVGTLPSRRAKLYAEAMLVLLNFNPIHETLEEQEAIPQLAFIAFEMCRRGVQRLTEDEVLDLLDRVRLEYRNVRAIQRRDSRSFLKLLEARSSIMIKSGGQWLQQSADSQPIWEFRHLTFQEYLASCALLEGRYLDRDKRLSLAQQVAPLAGVMDGIGEGEFQVSDSWREVLRLCVAGSKDDDVDEVLLTILAPQSGEDVGITSRPRAVLAALSLADEPNVSEETAELVIKSLVEQMRPKDARSASPVTTVARATAELGRSEWGVWLREMLLDRFFESPSAGDMAMSHTLGDYGVMYLYARGQSAASIESLHEDLLLGERQAVAAALVIMDDAFHDRRKFDEQTIEQLFGLAKRCRAATGAALWALYWIYERSGNPEITFAGEQWLTLSNVIADDDVDALALGSALRLVGSGLGPKQDRDYIYDWAVAADTSVSPPAHDTSVPTLEPLLIEQIRRRLDHPSAGVRRRASYVFGKLGMDDPRCVDCWIESLDDKDLDENTRRENTVLLGRWGGLRGAHHLAIRLESEDEYVRDESVLALIGIADDALIDIMLPILKSGRATARAYAATVIRTRHTYNALAALQAAVTSETDGYARRCMTEGIAKISGSLGAATSS